MLSTITGLLTKVWNWLNSAWNRLKVAWKLIVHRAWIAPLVLIVLFFAFGAEQTQDILTSIREAAAQPAQFDPQWLALVPLFALWISAYVLATSLGLAIRVAGVPAFLLRRRNLPNVEEVKDRQVVRACALVISLAVLVIVNAALGRALMGFPTAVAAFQYAVPVLGFIATLLVWRHKYSIPVFAALYFTFLALLFYTNDPRTFGFMIILTTPSLLFFTLLHILFKPIDKRDIINNILILIMFIILSVVIFIPWSSSQIWIIGSIPFVFIFISWVVCTITALVLLYRLQNWLYIDPIIAIAAVVLFLFMHHERYGREFLIPETPTEAAATCLPISPETVPDEPEASLAANGADFAIHADGGGLRAALFTAEVLSIADDMTCGDFGSHVAAASGVSGGSLGIATWAAMRQELVGFAKANGTTPWDKCQTIRGENQLPQGAVVKFDSPGPLGVLMESVLVRDHLSTVIAGMLLSDIWPWRTEAGRGQALLDSWQDAALRTIGETNPNSDRAFAIKLRNIDAGLPRAPLLMFTATNADSGERVVFSNAKWPSCTQADLSIGVAALHSARFPMISPAGLVRVGAKMVRVVDGGYFDNSGAATLKEVLESVPKPDLPRKVVIARINGNEPDNDESEKNNRTCDQFRALLFDRKYFGLPLLNPALRPTNSLADAPSPGRAEDVSLPAFAGFSTVDAYNAVRNGFEEEALNALGPLDMPTIVSRKLPQLQLDVMADFDPDCAASLKDAHPGDRLPDCATANLDLCSARLFEHAPLGWYLSAASANGIIFAARSSARRIAGDLRTSLVTQ